MATYPVVSAANAANAANLILFECAPDRFSITSSSPEFEHSTTLAKFSVIVFYPSEKTTFW
jgi:hypothetical protein